MPVILEDEKQNAYSFICLKTNIFSSIEEKLFRKEHHLEIKKISFTINNNKVNISKIIEENNIFDGSTIIFKIDKGDNSIVKNILLLICI